jgi:IS1 family transposase
MRERSRIMLLMNQLSNVERVQIIAALVEGNSINSTCRMTGRSKHTVLNLLVDIGEACQKYHDAHVRNVASKRIQVDEIWNFCQCKQKNVRQENKGKFGHGDVWTWTAVDADSKLIVSYLVGLRDAGYANEFMQDVSERLANRVQLTSDGLKVYLDAVEEAFVGDVDYSQLVKIYGPEIAGPARYSPPVCLSAEPHPICGDPDPAHISTSYVERQNLTMRMSMRRFTRLTNGFSKKIENMKHVVALNFMYYNFCRIHKSLRVTPAMEVGLADHVWELEEIVSLMV